MHALTHSLTHSLTMKMKKGIFIHFYWRLSPCTWLPYRYLPATSVWTLTICLNSRIHTSTPTFLASGWCGPSVSSPMGSYCCTLFITGLFTRLRNRINGGVYYYKQIIVSVLLLALHDGWSDLSRHPCRDHTIHHREISIRNLLGITSYLELY